MKRMTQILAMVIVAGVLLVAASAALAGRVGGPLRTVLNVPQGESVFLDIRFNTGTAIVSIDGDGHTLMQVYIYDSDGHISTGVGNANSKVATMQVYRSGNFRVEVRNYGVRDGDVTLSTN